MRSSIIPARNIVFKHFVLTPARATRYVLFSAKPKLQSQWVTIKRLLIVLVACLAMWGGWRTATASGDRPIGTNAAPAPFAPPASTSNVQLITLQGSGAGTPFGD